MLACLTWRVQVQQASIIGKYNDISLNEKDAGLISFIGSLLFLQQDFDKDLTMLTISLLFPAWLAIIE